MTIKNMNQAANSGVDEAMTAAQVFASAWALVGGPFDFGNAMENAEKMKEELEVLLRRRLDPAVAPALISVKDRLPDCSIECTNSGTEVSNTVLLHGECLAGYVGTGFGHLQDDGKWVCYEGLHDFMNVKEVTHWMTLPSNPIPPVATLANEEGKK
jgi:hypothetical protein